MHEQVLVVLQETPGEQAGVQVSLTLTLTPTPAAHEGAELARKHRFCPTTASGLCVCVGGGLETVYNSSGTGKKSFSTSY